MGGIAQTQKERNYAVKEMERISKTRSVSGHGFSRAANATKQRRALTPAGLQPSHKSHL
jgi:hypothetical protein